MLYAIVACLFISVSIALLNKAGDSPPNDLSRNRVGLAGLGFLLLGVAILTIQFLKFTGITN